MSLNEAINNIIAADVCFLAYRGDYFEQIGRITDGEDNNAPIDLTLFNGTLAMVIKRHRNDLNKVLELIEGDGLTVADTNQLTIATPFNMTAGIYQYDISGTIGGKIMTIQEGQIEVRNDARK